MPLSAGERFLVKEQGEALWYEVLTLTHVDQSTYVVLSSSLEVYLHTLHCRHLRRGWAARTHAALRPNPHLHTQMTRNCL